jgi:hypothetical protein
MPPRPVPSCSFFQVPHCPFLAAQGSLTDGTQDFVTREALIYLAQSGRLFLPLLDLTYIFHAITHEMIPTVRGALKELLSSEGGGIGKEKERKKLQARSSYWDE